MIEIRSGGTCAEWDAYVERSRGATLYHLSAWTEIVTRAYRVETYRVVSREEPGAPIRGVLPLYVVPRPFARYVTTGPFGSYGPMLADDDAAASDLLHAARRITSLSGARYLHVKSLGDAPPPAGFARQDVWVTALLPLEGGPPRLWSRLRKGARSAIRQASRNGFELARGKRHLEAFYDVLAENMHRKGAPIYGISFMRGLLDAFGDRADVVSLYEHGEAAAGALTISYRGVLYVPFASSRHVFLPLRPNHLLYWRILESACAEGMHTFDFGSSMRETSTLAFKHHWGALIEPVASYVYSVSRDPSGKEPDLGPTSSAVQRGVSLWKRLPRRVADRAGPWLCRFLL